MGKIIEYLAAVAEDEPVFMQKHDEKYHHGRFNPKTMHCGIRENDDADDIERGDADADEAYRTKKAYESERSGLFGHGALGNTTVLNRTQYKEEGLADAIRETGMNTRTFCMANGLDCSRVFELLTGLSSPVINSGGHTHWTNLSSKVAAALGKEPVQIFPKHAHKVLSSRDSANNDTYAKQEATEELIDKGNLEKTIKKVLNTLSPKEKDVIEKRYGLDGEDPKSRDEIAKILGCSSEKVRQTEFGALWKLRQPSILKKLKMLDLGDSNSQTIPAQQVGVVADPEIEDVPSNDESIRRKGAAYLKLCGADGK